MNGHKIALYDSKTSPELIRRCQLAYVQFLPLEELLLPLSPSYPPFLHPPYLSPSCVSSLILHSSVKAISVTDGRNMVAYSNISTMHAGDDKDKSS